ncbi:MAG: Cof-type HAD-IIB family hydrolase [Oscillospiraceae bacterium]
MDCKIIFLDIDGTLTNSKKIITEKTLNTLIKVQQDGIILALASGRPDKGIKPFTKTLQLDKFGGYILSFNGARVKNVQTGKIIYENSLSKEAFKFAYQLSKKYKVDIITYNDDYIISETDNNKYLDIESKINKIPVKVVSNMVDFVDYNPVKCLMLGDGDYLATIEKEIKIAMGDLANVYRSEPFFLEIVPNGVDKATSIEKLISSIGIEHSKTMAFGDGFNDISMVKYVSCGVAMANGCDKIKSIANFITSTNDEDGIAEFLNKHLSI